MGDSSFTDMKVLFERAASELEAAARHCRIAAEHFASEEVPRGCAHGFAALGNVSVAQEHLTAATQLHSTKART